MRRGNDEIELVGKPEGLTPKTLSLKPEAGLDLA